MRTIAITHRSHGGNCQPFSMDELRQLRSGHFIAIGTNWRHRDASAWADDSKAKQEFDLFELVAKEGAWVIANYELEAHQRLIGRVAPSISERPESWNGLHRLGLSSCQIVDVRVAGLEDLQVSPGRTIVDVTKRAGDRVRKHVDGQ